MAEAVVTPSDPLPEEPTTPALVARRGGALPFPRPKYFARRRICLGMVTLAAAAMLMLMLRALAVGLHQDAFVSGWLLLVLVAFLGAYNLRKKLSFLPLGRSSVWLQLHIYVGLLSIIVFVAHGHGRVPHGPFEILLAGLFLGTALSGIAGLAMTRTFPARLSDRGEQVLFARIPAFRQHLRNLIELAVTRSIVEDDAATLADFYSARAASFFTGPKNFSRHLIQSTRPREKLLAELADLHRYLNKHELEIAAEMHGLIEAKDDLDHQYALQATLKWWLFIHLPLTYSLLLTAAVHLLLVQAFSGGGG